MFDKNKIMQENVVVHCKTKEEAKELLAWADGQGMRWCNGGSYLNINEYSMYGDQTCYCLKAGEFGKYNSIKASGYTIYTIEEARKN